MCVPQPARVILIAIIGTLLCLIGIVMVPLPGPGVLVIAAGLAILAIEFAWARRCLRRGKVKALRSWQRGCSLANGCLQARCRWIPVPIERGKSRINQENF